MLTGPFKITITIVLYGQDQVCPPGLMASKGNVQEGPTPPLASPR